ncbi:hypothetical protein SARC_03509 [Sphaeroforma arctica JP610]|uniref:Uncharacterized protein n=1 Tax=Sphaeroforma arctica JP610 TaxID=667725 RepID=A0A0L0G5Z0_9EUKA|nr:hypothetical protein SARC_03509 [Sphaeroforma arctica JP610]KNC84261.1 hypothetical protein SARC_03509 [Sphaeroforma arctica JP610]|eukprot:XP_014158163.1 hypothetical protein SARC_03509 [Sphaeroforma arctica JP610]
MSARSNLSLLVRKCTSLTGKHNRKFGKKGQEGASDDNMDIVSASETDTDSDDAGPADGAVGDHANMDESETSSDEGDVSGPGEHPGYARPVNH